jgi:hypothetical protein
MLEGIFGATTQRAELAMAAISAAGMRTVEAKAAHAAAEKAIRDTRSRWLPKLRRWAARAEGPRRAFLELEIRRLERGLKIPPTDERRRAQTRERVRRHRKRKAGGAGSLPRATR